MASYAKSLQQNKYFNTQVGSLSGNEFHQEKNFRLKESIHKNHILEIHYHEKQNFHENRELLAFSWLASLNKNWSLGLLGDFKHEKKYDDIGYHIQFQKKHSKHYFSHYFPNYSLNKRNASTDTYKRSYFPQVVAYRYQKNSEKKLSDFVIRYSKESLWRFPDDNKQFRQNSYYLHFLQLEKNLKNFQNQWGISLSNHKIDEEDSSSNLSARKKQKYLKIHYQRLVSDKLERQIAAGFEIRSLIFENINQKAPLHYFSPFFRWAHLNSRWKHQLVYSHFHSLDDRELLGFTKSFEKHLIYAAEYKLPLKKNIDWVFGLSIDLDRFGSDDTWEGGYSKMFWSF